MSIASGNVKAWDDASGSGWIAAPDGGDIFVQRPALTDGTSLSVGSLVTYEQAWDPALNRRVAKMCVGAVNGGASGPGLPADMGGCAGAELQAAGEADAQGRTGAAWANMPAPSDNLYICGLPMTCSEEQLRSIFSAYGSVVSVKVLPDNGKPDRAALVRMSELSQAQWLVDNVNQNIPLGLNSPIVVRFAQRSANKISTGETMTGIVKVWLEAKGMGFVMPAAGGEDYFVHRSDLCDGHSLIQGSTISFDPGWDVQKNKPVAKKVVGAVPAPAGSPAAVAAVAAPPAVPVAAAVQAPPGLRDGVVKVWFEEKGYGFISPSDGQGDTFVHRSAIQGANSLVQGSPVKFSAEMDVNRGRFIARQCYPSGTPPAPAPPPAVVPVPSPVPAAPPAVAGGIAGAMKSGTVKVWFEEKGYGFITADDGSGDIFAHRSSLTDGGSLAAGARVFYEAQWNAVKCKTIAVKVAGASQAPGAGAAAAAALPALPAPAGGAGVAPQAAQPSDEVILSCLPATVTEASLMATFAPYGAVVECHLLPDDAQGKVARLRMGSQAQAAWLVQNLNGNMPVGLETPIQVAYAPAGGYGAAADPGAGVRAAPY